MIANRARARNDYAAAQTGKRLGIQIKFFDISINWVTLRSCAAMIPHGNHLDSATAAVSIRVSLCAPVWCSGFDWLARISGFKTDIF